MPTNNKPASSLDSSPSSRVEARSTLTSYNPATGDRLGEVFVDSPATVAAAVRRARVAQRDWAALGVAGRNRILNRLPGVLIDRSREIGEVVSAENGKPPTEAIGLVLPICETIKLYTKLAARLESGVKVSPTFFFGSKARIFYDPVGVAGYILPWNFPFELGMKHLLPALAAGNAVVQKPSEQNPLIGELVASLFRDAGVPDGVVQMVHGYADVGAALIDEVDVVCFVGSPNTGRKIMERASRTLTPVVLELGGNDAAIVRADADLQLTARGLVNGTCFNSGQVCNGIERIYVPRHLVAPLTDQILEVLDALRTPREGAYERGPVTWKPQLEVYRTHTDDAVAKGARLMAGGEPDEALGGSFWKPTVLTEMTHDMLMMTEETFGPFLPIMAVDDDEQAIALANDSQYGLGGSVWTRDVRAGKALARRIRAGSVMVNNAVQSGGCVTLPFGGQGESGVGRVQGEMGYYHYVAAKSVMTSPRLAADLWMPYHDGAVDMIGGLTRILHGRSITERVRGVVAFLRNQRPRGGS